MVISIRRANPDDLPEIVDIWYRSEAEEGPTTLPYPLQPPVMFGHLLATSDVRVADDGARLLGFVVLTTRGLVNYLALMFVRGEHQSRGVGRGLLEAVLPPAAGIYCTLASTDPRAQALYIRAGMRPDWPNVHLVSEVAGPRPRPAAGVTVVEAARRDPEIMRWDREISGQDRPQDHAALGDTLPAVPLWFIRTGKTIGYGYVHTASEAVLDAPDAYSVGPIGARTPEDAANCVLAAVDWASARARVVRIALPGPHPALAPLLDAGFRIIYVEAFMSSGSEPVFDPRCYCPTSAGLL